MILSVQYNNKLLLVIVLIAIFFGAGISANLNPQNTKQHLIVSTTTSLYETGILDMLKTEFEKQNPEINVSFISQGTGLAIQTAMRGDADMILVHDPERELDFLKNGYGVNRKIISYNFFVIVGPIEDPAGVKGLSPSDALLKIREFGEQKLSTWVSRVDDSGTHSKEKILWQEVGMDTKDLSEREWYLEAGSGMTSTLLLANEKGAYTLCDLATYLTNYKNGNIELSVVVEAGKEMLNVYSAIVNNPMNTEVSKSNFNISMLFIKFLVSEETQNILMKYGDDAFGKPLFNSYINLLKSKNDPEIIGWIKEIAFFDGNECPPKYRYQDEDIYSIFNALSLKSESII